MGGLAATAATISRVKVASGPPEGDLPIWTVGLTRLVDCPNATNRPDREAVCTAIARAWKPSPRTPWNRRLALGRSAPPHLRRTRRSRCPRRREHPHTARYRDQARRARPHATWPCGFRRLIALTVGHRLAGCAPRQLQRCATLRHRCRGMPASAGSGPRGNPGWRPRNGWVGGQIAAQAVCAICRRVS